MYRLTNQIRPPAFTLKHTLNQLYPFYCCAQTKCALFRWPIDRLTGTAVTRSSCDNCQPPPTQCTGVRTSRRCHRDAQHPLRCWPFDAIHTRFISVRSLRQHPHTSHNWRQLSHKGLPVLNIKIRHRTEARPPSWTASAKDIDAPTVRPWWRKSIGPARWARVEYWRRRTDAGGSVSNWCVSARHRPSWDKGINGRNANCKMFRTYIQVLFHSGHVI